MTSLNKEVLGDNVEKHAADRDGHGDTAEAARTADPFGYEQRKRTCPDIAVQVATPSDTLENSCAIGPQGAEPRTTVPAPVGDTIIAAAPGLKAASVVTHASEAKVCEAPSVASCAVDTIIVTAPGMEASSAATYASEEEHRNAGSRVAPSHHRGTKESSGVFAKANALSASGYTRLCISQLAALRLLARTSRRCLLSFGAYGLKQTAPEVHVASSSACARSANMTCCRGPTRYSVRRILFFLMQQLIRARVLLKEAAANDPGALETVNTSCRNNAILARRLEFILLAIQFRPRFRAERRCSHLHNPSWPMVTLAMSQGCRLQTFLRSSTPGGKVEQQLEHIDNRCEMELNEEQGYGTDTLPQPSLDVGGVKEPITNQRGKGRNSIALRVFQQGSQCVFFVSYSWLAKRMLGLSVLAPR